MDEVKPVYRDGKVHVAAAECDTCIFRPRERFIEGSRVAELVKATVAEEGSTVTCHHTTYGQDPEGEAICRGWYDRLGSKDNIIRLAQARGIIEEQEVPTWKPEP